MEHRKKRKKRGSKCIGKREKEKKRKLQESLQIKGEVNNL
jgi:hypothetical protein